MSMMMCELCDRYIDSDDDPECFVEVPWMNLEEHVWCERCRDEEFGDNAQEEYFAGMDEAMAEKDVTP